MPDPSRLRDSTQIVVESDELDGLRPELESEFMVTVWEENEGYLRIIGSPIEIKAASDFLTRHGVSLP